MWSEDMLGPRGIRLAFSLLTGVPAGRVDWPEARRQDTAAWFPLVGAVLGLGGFALVTAFSLADALTGSNEMLAGSSWPMAVVLVGAWAATTRLLHWDGLADVADGYWGGDSRERRLEIMADPHTGAFGAAAVALAMIAQVIAVATVFAGEGRLELGIYAAPVFGRLAASVCCWVGKPARPGGLGASIMGRPSIGAGVIAAVTVFGVAAGMLVVHGIAGGVFCVLALGAALIVPHLLSGRFGGVTGDVMGASVIVVETLALLVAAFGSIW
jgi:adenosylcobinamide-GDP ribazoletransferase